MSWLSEITEKAESLLNKIDQKTANFLSSSDLANVESRIDSNILQLVNSQSLPQIKNNFGHDYDFPKYAHSRNPSATSLNGLTLKVSGNEDLIKSNNVNMSKNVLIQKKIDDNKFFDYLNNLIKEDSLESSTTNANILNNGKEDIIVKTNETYTTNTKNEANLNENLVNKNETDINENKKIKASNLKNNNNFIKEIEELKIKLNLEQMTKEKFEQEVIILNSSFASLKSDFEEYKIRAQRTLQSKDDLIANLQKVTITNSDHQLENSIHEINNLELNLETISKEHDELKLKYDNLLKINGNLSNHELINLKDKLVLNESQIKKLNSINNNLEEELKKLENESKFYQNELTNSNQNIEQLLKEKNNEIASLKNKLLDIEENQFKNNQIPKDLELKIKNLTENLLKKQSIVENLNREKNLLLLQLEESKSNLLNSIKKSHQSENHYVNFKNGGLFERNICVNNTDKKFSTLSPVVKRVRRAYGQLDNLSCRITLFLRTYPFARVILIFYIIILHFWVFFILFSRKPEV